MKVTNRFWIGVVWAVMMSGMLWLIVYMFLRLPDFNP